LTPRGEKGTSRYIPEVGEAPFSNHPTRPSQGGFFIGRNSHVVFCLEPAGRIARPGSGVSTGASAVGICADFTSLADSRENPKLPGRNPKDFDTYAQGSGSVRKSQS
jgi:hypothetical protein